MEKSSNHRIISRVEYFPRLLKPIGYFLLALSAFKLYFGLGLTIHAQLPRWLAVSRETVPDLLAAIFCFKFATQYSNWASKNAAPTLLRKDARQLTIVAWLFGGVIMLWPYGPFVSDCFSGSFTLGQLVKFDVERKRWKPIV